MITLTEKLAALMPRPNQGLPRNTLELFLPDGWPEREAEILWCVRYGASVSHGRAANLMDLPANLRSTQLLVWTPPADTLLTQTTLPTRSWSKIAQALPYALENQLLGDPEQMHFAYHRRPDGSLAVAVTARERLKTWLDTLQAAGLHPTRLSPSTLALPLDNNGWSVAFTDDGILVRTGLFAGFACPPSVRTPPAVLTAALGEARDSPDVPARLTIFNPPEGFSHDDWNSALGLPVAILKHNFWDDAMTPALNLLQGDFAPTGKLQGTLRRFSPALVILGLWLVGTLGFTFLEWWQLNQAQQSYRDAMTTLFRQTFPEAKAVLDPALQMQRNLETLQAQGGHAGASDLLPLLARAAPTLRANPSVTLRTVKYADGKLTLDLSLPDFEALEIIKNTISSSGRTAVEVLAANSRAAGVEGRLRIQTDNTTDQE